MDFYDFKLLDEKLKDFKILRREFYTMLFNNNSNSDKLNRDAYFLENLFNQLIDDFNDD